jgi:hypothetical protein
MSTARVTSAEILAILPLDDSNDGNPPDVESYIISANLFVSEELSSAGLSVARLKQIELYLAAHFATVTLEKGGLTRQKIGESEDYFQAWSNTETGIKSTRYGQQAVMLDSSGTLSALAAGSLRAQFSLVSKVCSPYGRAPYYPFWNTDSTCN